MQEEILSEEVKSFLNKLTKKYSKRLNNLLEERNSREGIVPDFDPNTAFIRNNLTWRIDNSGADVYMSDFEDSNCPTWDNCIQGQINLRDAVRGTIEYTNPKNDKNYSLNDKTAVLFVRPRGLHLVEKNYLVDGNPIPAAFFDFGTYLVNNYKQILAKGSRPYFYLPKLEHYKEAILWDDIFVFAQEELGMKTGTIKATVLIETLPAAFQMDEILFFLKRHSAGLNCGRWDYIFSFIKTMKNYRNFVIPDRKDVGMTQHFMRSYSQLLIQTCHKRHAHAMGGMAAQIPAMNKVCADKLREVTDGHDGTWVAHPALVPVAKDIFENNLTESNQIEKQVYYNSDICQADLLCVPKGQCTEEGLRENIRVGFLYLNAWINGTAEISRAQIWQWLKWGVKLSDGKELTMGRFDDILTQELKNFKNLERFEDTKKIFNELCVSNELVDFLTPTCYDALQH
jgi:malate synthase